MHIIMRYFVEYGHPARTNKWGHFLPEQPPVHKEYFGTLDEAVAFAARVHSKKTHANIFDCKGPKLEGDSARTWLVGGWDKNIYYPNNNYKL